MFQCIPDWILSRLDLTRPEESLVPKHLHLARVFLPSYLREPDQKKTRTGLSVYAPPPERFLSTAAALRINADAVERLFEADAVKTATRSDLEGRAEAQSEVRVTHEGGA